MSEFLLNTMDERRRRIAAKAEEASSDARKEAADRILSVVPASFSKPALARFLALTPEQRTKHCEVLAELMSKNIEERDRLLAKAQEYDDDELCYSREIEALMGKRAASKKASVIAKQAANDLTATIELLEGESKKRKLVFNKDFSK